jgi:hypothetical protein
VSRRRISGILGDMERVNLLRARIGLYRRYLSEGADGDLARTYLWLIRQDEIELTALVGTIEKDSVSEAGASQALSPARLRTRKNDH